MPDGSPRKTLYYVPLQDLLSLAFGDKDGEDLRLNVNDDDEFEDDPLMTDITESPLWKKFVIEDQSFCGELRNIVIKFSTDGFPLDKLMRISAWAGASQLLNRSPQTRSKPHNMWLHWMTTGGKTPKNLQSIMSVLVDDLLEGHRNGFRVVDASKKEQFLCKVKLLVASADLPGMQL